MMLIGERVGAKLTHRGACPDRVGLLYHRRGDHHGGTGPESAGQPDPGRTDAVLMVSVAVGVGISLALAFLRSLFGWSLSRILLVCYGVLFLLTAFVPGDFLAVALTPAA